MNMIKNKINFKCISCNNETGTERAYIYMNLEKKDRKANLILECSSCKFKSRVVIDL